MSHDATENQPDGLGEVQCLAGLGHDLVRLAQVGVNIRGDTLLSAGQQRAGMGQHHRVVVDIHDAGLGRYPLRDLMGVIRSRQPGPDIEELPDSRIFGQVADAAGQEAPGSAGDITHTRECRGPRVAGLPVDGKVVLAAEPVIPDPGRVRHGGVNPGRGSVQFFRSVWACRTVVGHRGSLKESVVCLKQNTS